MGDPEHVYLIPVFLVNRMGPTFYLTCPLSLTEDQDDRFVGWKSDIDSLVVLVLEAELSALFCPWQSQQNTSET